MSSRASSHGHSALVDIRLLVAGRGFRVTQLTADCVVLDSTTDLPPTDATLRIEVDNETFERPVALPDGLSARSREARIGRQRAACAQPPPT